MQLARAFAAICLGFIASLSLQGCGSDDADTVSAAGDTNETTVTVTMTETMTMTTTSTDYCVASWTEDCDAQQPSHTDELIL